VKRYVGPLVVGVAALAGVVILFVVTRTAKENQAPASAPTGVPAAGTCYAADDATRAKHLPWPVAPVDCAAAHTVEIAYAGPADRAIVGQANGGDEQARTGARVAMTVEAGRTCAAKASEYLGGKPWRTARVSLGVVWVDPTSAGFFTCILTERAAVLDAKPVTRTGSVKGTPLPAGCVTGETLAYAPCDQPHDGEFVGVYTVANPNWPGPDKAKEFATKGCQLAAAGFLGIPSDAKRDDLTLTYDGPTTQASWIGGDPSFACYATVPPGTPKLRGSLRGITTAPLPHP